MLSLLYNNIILLFFIIITIKLNSNYFKLNKYLFNSCLFYHGCSTLVYVSLLSGSGKAADYYTYLTLQIPPNDYSFFSTNFIYQFIRLFKNLFLNDFNIIVIFSLISFFGIIIFIQNLIKLGIERKIAYTILFIPGLHFWTTIIGKDCLILFFLSYFFHLYIDRKIFFSIILLMLVFLIRPHIGLIFLLSVAITEIIIIKGYRKFILLLISLIIFYIFFNLPYIQDLLYNSSNILSQNIILQTLNELSEYAQKYTHTDTHYDSSNLYVNMFNYVIFPLEFILKNNSFVVNSYILIEIFTLIFLSILILNHKKDFKIDKRIIYFLFICTFIYLMIMPQTFFNFGLNTRQKWMIIPFIIYLSFLVKNLFVRIKKM